MTTNSPTPFSEKSLNDDVTFALVVVVVAVAANLADPFVHVVVPTMKDLHNVDGVPTFLLLVFLIPLDIVPVTMNDSFYNCSDDRMVENEEHEEASNVVAAVGGNTVVDDTVVNGTALLCRVVVVMEVEQTWDD